MSRLVPRPLVNRLRRSLRRARKETGEWRARGRPPRPDRIRVLMPLLLHGFLAPSILLGSSIDRSSPVVVTALSLYATGMALWQTGQLRDQLSGSWAAVVLAHLPAGDDLLFRLTWNRVARRSLWPIWAVTLGLWMIGANGFRPSLFWLAPVFALLMWVASVSFAAVVTVLFERLWLRLIGSAVVGLSIVLNQERVRALAEPSSELLALLTPAGWAARAFDLVSRGAMVGLAWLLPVVVLAALVRTAKRALRERYVGPGEIVSVIPGGEAAQSEQLENEAAGSWEVNAIRLEGHVPARVENAILDRSFLDDSRWSGPQWIERAFRALLSPRERAITMFMAPLHLDWSRRWMIASAISLVGAAVALGLPRLGEPWLWLPILLSTMIAAPVLGGSWRAFRPIWIPGSPPLAIYPVGYTEMSRVVGKANVLRIVAWLPLAIGWGLLDGQLLGSIADGAVLSLKIAYAVLCVQPLLLVARFSQGTNDTEHLGFTRLIGAAAILLSLLLLIGSLAVFLMWRSGRALYFGFVPPVITLGQWWTYRLLYHRSGIDLVSTRTDQF